MAYDFDKIARDYDRMNRLMTLGLDCRWRRRAVRTARLHAGDRVLDVACGTGDMLALLQRSGCSATGIDLSGDMLAQAQCKVPEATLMQGDAERLPFDDATFDAVTCAFGVRNFVHLEVGLKEMLRVLKPGGCMVILELATPDSTLVRPFYNLYTRKIIPWLGARLAGSREAYTYLPQSIERFPKGEAFRQTLLSAGASNARHGKLTFGVCRIYETVK